MSIEIGPTFTLGLTFVLVGVLGFTRELTQAIWAAASANWPRLDGDLLAVGMDMRTAQRGYLGIRQDTFTPIVRYQYVVDGQLHVGNRIGYDGLALYSLRATTRALHGYKPHHPVAVYVCPRDPQLSVLRAGLDWTNWVGIATTCATVIVGIVLML